MGNILSTQLHCRVPDPTEAQELVVLQQHLRAWAREVQGKRRHVAAEVAHSEDEILWQPLRFAPDHPADPWVHEPVLVARGRDRPHALEAEIPHDVWLQEWRDHGAGCTVNVNRHVEAGVCLDRVECRRDRCHRLVCPGVGDTHDRDDADGVLVDVLLEFMPVKAWVLLGDRHHPHLDVPIIAKLLPTHLHRRTHHEVRRLGRLPCCAARDLPRALEREPAEHARLR